MSEEEGKKAMKKWQVQRKAFTDKMLKYLENTTPVVSPFLEYHIGSKLTIKITHRVYLYRQIELLINAIGSFA
jgi:hypothetical protein